MRIAIPYENGDIFPRFGEAASFKLYNLEDEKILSEVVVPSFGGAAAFLKAARADVVVCGAITAEEQRQLLSVGIAVWPGMGGAADDAARAFASGRFQSCGHDHQHCDDASCPHHRDGGCEHCH